MISEVCYKWRHCHLRGDHGDLEAAQPESPGADSEVEGKPREVMLRGTELSSG